MHIKIKLKLQSIMKAQRGNRDILYISTLSLTSALELGWVANATPRPLYTREWLGTGGCVGTSASLLVRRICQKSRM